MDLQRLYSRLIEVCEVRNGKPSSPTAKAMGYESHHIKPRSMGGADEAVNLVYLTPREHYTAHHILARLCGGKMANAFWYMSHLKPYKITARQYETAKNAYSASLSDRMRGKPKSAIHVEKMRLQSLGANNPMYGLKLSDETKGKISQSLKGRKHSQETKDKIRQSNLGKHSESKPHTDEHKLKIGNALRGKAKPRKDCPYCKRSIAAHAFYKWHGDNCKMNN